MKFLRTLVTASGKNIPNQVKADAELIITPTGEVIKDRYGVMVGKKYMADTVQSDMARIQVLIHELQNGLWKQYYDVDQIKEINNIAKSYQGR